MADNDSLKDTIVDALAEFYVGQLKPEFDEVKKELRHLELKEEAHYVDLKRQIDIS